MLADLILEESLAAYTAKLTSAGTYADCLVEQVYGRDMKELDPSPSLYVFALPGYPNPEEAKESGQLAPGYWCWPVQIQVRVRSGDEETARTMRSTILWRVTREFFNRQGLGGTLMALSESDDGVTERAYGLTVHSIDRFASKDKSGGWIYLGAITGIIKAELQMR